MFLHHRILFSAWDSTMHPQDVEKDQEQSVNIEKIASATDDIQAFTPKEQARVIRKLDFHLLPLCFILYTFSVLDRSNLGNAATAGLEDDIDLSGNRYHLLGVSFYVAYIVFQFSSFGWKLFKPHVWVVRSNFLFRLLTAIAWTSLLIYSDVRCSSVGNNKHVAGYCIKLGRVDGMQVRYRHQCILVRNTFIQPLTSDPGSSSA